MLTNSETALLGIAATILVAVLSALTAFLASKRERRRVLYSEAVQSIVGWKEMLYRVRRRAAGQERDLINLFHDLQDKLTYYEAWVGSESKYMSRSYAKLVADVKSATESSIQQAWQGPVRQPPGDALPSDSHPDIKAFVDRFLGDVRSHLSPLPWRKAAVACRNREGK